MALEPLTGWRVVDLYAGSGALGIEALSRGAEHVDFVESARPARLALEANLETLGLGDRSRVWPLELPRGLGRLADPIRRANLILLDPPYGGTEARSALEALVRLELEPAVRVVLEHHSRDDVPEACGPLRRSRQRRYGETCVSTYTLSGTEGRPDQAEEGAR